jgi:protein-S-isoprenylcysteine O-methyltransferase Ste14
MKKIVSVPPNYFYLCIILSTILRLLFPEFKVIPAPYNFTGIVLIALGLYLVIDSWYIFKKHNTPESFEPTTCLVKNDIYKYSRNPMYLGGVLFLTGLSVALNNLLSFASPFVFFLVMNYMFIPYEENELTKAFGNNYLDYKKKVRRWI